VKWLADECFDNDIVRGLLLRCPTLDLIRAQDVGEIAGGRPEAADMATGNERVLLTHDLATMAPVLLVQRQQESGCTLSRPWAL